MNCLPPHVSRHQIQRFHPLMLIDDQFHGQLIEKSIMLNFDKGDYLFRKNEPDTSHQSFYLVSGIVDIRSSIFSRCRIESTDHAARYPLEEKVAGKAAAIAKCQVKVLAFNKDYIDYLLARSQSQDNVVNINQQLFGTIPTAETDEETEPDWMWNLLQSPLFSKITPTNIQQMFAAFEDTNYQTGDTIIRKGETGDYFYVIKHGRVKIILDGQEDECIVRGPGDYFGEDALLAETPRSATVSMVQDGILARLDKTRFQLLLRDAIIQTIDMHSAQQLLGDPIQDCILLDVRLAAEYRHQHQQGSQNIPLGSLRQKIAEFDNSKIYLVTDDGGRRSELATHWLNQSGLNSYLVKKNTG